MINGELDVDEVPKVWNEKMQKYLGCTPKDDVQVRQWRPCLCTTLTASTDVLAAVACLAAASLPHCDIRGIAATRGAMQGCLQDIRWSMGALGYFTTYTLGAMYAAQIFNAAKKDMPDLEKNIEDGKFSGLREWLREKVHKLGSVPADGDELMKAVTGEPLNVSIFLKYLRDKYHALYKL